MKKIWAVVIMVLSLAIVGCGGGTTTTGSIFTEKDMAVNAINALKEFPGLKGKEIKVFKNIIVDDTSSYGSMIDLDILRPGTKDTVDHYTYKKGRWENPRPVRLTGSGEMEAYVLSIDEIDFSKIPDMYKACEAKAKEIEKGKAEKRLVYSVVIGEGKFKADIEIKGAHEAYYGFFDAKGNLVNFKKQ